MKCMLKAVTAAALFLFVSAGLSFCQTVDIINLVDQYAKDTDVQKAAIEKEYLGRKISVAGAVSDVSQEKTFDIVNDTERLYYKVITDTVQTTAGNPYRAVLIYKDKDKVKDINKGQKILFTGNIIRIVDDRLYLSVWLSADDLTDKEKELFK